MLAKGNSVLAFRTILNLVIFCAATSSPLTLWAKEKGALPQVNIQAKSFLFETSQYINLPASEQKNIAEQFGLTTKQYQQYLYYIYNTPDRYYFNQSQTSPLWVLASHVEDNPTLFNQYITRSAKIAHEETERLEKVDKAFTKAVHTLYPNELPVMTSALKAKGLRAGDEVRLYCNLNSAACSYMLSFVLPRIQSTQDIRLDLFVLGAKTKSAIFKFAKTNQIPVKMVSEGRVTLNFGDRPFKLEKQVIHSSQPLSLPYLVVIRDGHQVLANLTKKVVS